MNRLMIAVSVASTLVTVANAETHTVPDNTTETVTSENAATYNAYESITVPKTAGLDFTDKTASTSFAPPVTVASGGSFVVSNGADVVLGTQKITLSGNMLVTNATMRRATLPGDEAAANASLIVQSGDLVIEEGSVVSNRFNIGYDWGVGRVVQNGGTVVNIGDKSGTEANQPAYGCGGGSYYELRGGTHELWGTARLGGTSYGGSVFAMYGGTFMHTTRNGQLSLRCACGYSACGWYQFGGKAQMEKVIIGAWTAPMAMYVGGTGTTFSSSSFSAVNSYGIRNNHTDVITIGDGATWSGAIALTAQSSTYNNRLVLTVNFDGATVDGIGSWGYLSHANLEAVPDTPSLRNVICSGGLTLESPDKSPIIIVPLRGTTGKGVKSVNWDKTKTYSCCPVIIIEETGGGKGYGAEAVPIYDPVTKRITDIKVVASGCDYTVATAYLMIGSSSGGEQSNTEQLTTELADNENTGGLTVKSGNWYLRSVCTYGGVTEIAGGTVYLDGSGLCQGSLPTNTALRLTGGKLSLGGSHENTQTFRSIGGTAGSFKNGPNAYSVECLDIDTANTLDLSRFTLTVTGRWDVAAADIAAGKCADYKSTIVFGDTATIDVSDLAETTVRKYPIAKATTMTGAPTPVGRGASAWKVSNSGNALYLTRKRGLLCLIY